MTPDNSTPIPDDLLHKYMKLFKGKKVFEALLDLMNQTYMAGLEIGRKEKIKKYEKFLDKIYK